MFQYARELLSAEGGDPRIVLAASLLLETVGGQPAAEDRAAEAKRVLEGIGLDEDTIGCVCHVLTCYWAGEDLDTVEFKIVSDSRALAMRGTARSESAREGDDRTVKQELRTEAGRQKVQALP
jgi:hypothetical protein